ncbi:MAG: choline dehydrogenase [Coxiellaceae bacterium]|nr:choline dehydrogenase [Coxiellaceae bacterium]
MQTSYDYIIIGAGSAGCVLANRLTSSGQYRVLLIEAGGSDKSLYIKMPAALSYPMNMEKYNWGYESQPEPYLNNRVLICPRGKVLGGTSSINGMVYVRGNAHDFDQWQQLGAKGWGYRDCLPYFKRAESWQGGNDEYRGAHGPLVTCGGNNMRTNPLYKAFIQAGKQAGYPTTDDYNGYQQEGFGPMHMTVKNGVRCSTYAAYLKPVLHRRNLTVIKNSLVKKVIVKNKIATGVECIYQGRHQKIYANKEVILSAGAIASPMLLQLSGIGPTQILQAANVQVEHDLPGVGENLQDHIEVYFQYRCKQPITLNDKFDWYNKAKIGLKWLLFRKGLGATNHYESCAFIKSSPDRQWPDIQYHFLPAAVRYDGGQPIDGHGFQLHVGPNKPRSRGRIHIYSNDMRAKPFIQFNYFQHEDDRKAWRACIRKTRQIISQQAMDDYRGDVVQPAEGIQSDQSIDQWVQANAESAFHPCGTCKMGDESDVMAVVNSNCQVRGIERLRVVDASIFPTITNGNLNAPTIMVAEKAADIILNKTPLLPSTATVYADQVPLSQTHVDRAEQLV